MPRPQRNFKLEYERRLALAERRGLTRTQARGHPQAGEQPAHIVIAQPNWTVTILTGDPARLVTLRVGFRDSQRAGRYDRLVLKLAEARISPKEFRARARRLKPIGGYRLLADPKAAIALIVMSEPTEWIFESGRRT